MGTKLTATEPYVHSGVVTHIDGPSVFVTLDPDLHCESCHARGACGVKDTGGRVVEVTDPGEVFRPNEPVQVILAKDLGNKALLWAYLLPFLLMILTLFTASLWLPEWLAGLLSLFMLIPYYGSVALFRKYFRKTFKISLQRYEA